jgi:hypothetical protein
VTWPPDLISKDSVDTPQRWPTMARLI